MADRKYSQQDLIQQATLTEKDIDQIKRCRRSHNRIGFAYPGESKDRAKCRTLY